MNEGKKRYQGFHSGVEMDKNFDLSNELRTKIESIKVEEVSIWFDKEISNEKCLQFISYLNATRGIVAAFHFTNPERMTALKSFISDSTDYKEILKTKNIFFRSVCFCIVCEIHLSKLQYTNVKPQNELIKDQDQNIDIPKKRNRVI